MIQGFYNKLQCESPKLSGSLSQEPFMKNQQTWEYALDPPTKNGKNTKQQTTKTVPQPLKDGCVISHDRSSLRPWIFMLNPCSGIACFNIYTGNPMGFQHLGWTLDRGMLDPWIPWIPKNAPGVFWMCGGFLARWCFFPGIHHHFGGTYMYIYIYYICFFCVPEIFVPDMHPGDTFISD